MGVFDLIRSRRSVRRFTPEPIPEAVLIRMVDAARLAPSGANLQPLKYLVVTAPDLKKELFPLLKWAAYINPAGNPPPGHEPTAYVVVLADEDVKTGIYMYDVGFSVANMLIAGLDKGVAACVLKAFDAPAVSRLFGLPENLRPDLVVALGYPDETPIFEDRSDTIKYYRDENNLHVVPKRPLDEVMFLNRVSEGK